MNLISLNTAELTNLTHTTSTITKSGSEMSIYVYAAELEYGGAAQNFSKNIVSQIDNGPVSDLIHSAVDSGYLVPGKNSLTSNPAIFSSFGNIIFYTVILAILAGSLSFTVISRKYANSAVGVTTIQGENANPQLKQP